MEANMRVMGVLMGKVKEIPSVDTTLTKSGFAADAKVVGEKLDELSTNRLGAEDVVNSLESNATDKPLSAAMGKELKSMVTQSGNDASGVAYNGGNSDLDATNVQDAIDELADGLEDRLSVDSGKMRGNTIIFGGGHSSVTGDNSSVAICTNVDAPGFRRGVYVNNQDRDPDLMDAVVLLNEENDEPTNYKIFGEHNMTQGVYYGDEKFPRTIDVKSAGNALMVVSDHPGFELFAIVFSKGCFSTNGAAISFHFGGMTYSNGELRINLPAYNSVGVTYYWYAI